MGRQLPCSHCPLQPLIPYAGLLASLLRLSSHYKLPFFGLLLLCYRSLQYIALVSHRLSATVP